MMRLIRHTGRMGHGLQIIFFKIAFRNANRKLLFMIGFPYIIFVNFEFSMALIKALITPSAEKTYEDIKRVIPYLRAPKPGEEEKAIEFVKRSETFQPTQVDNFAKFLYDDLVKKLSKLKTEPPS